jgi:hypothetical protein
MPNNTVLPDETFNLADWWEVLPGDEMPAGHFARVSRATGEWVVVRSAAPFMVPSATFGEQYFAKNPILPTELGSKIYNIKVNSNDYDYVYEEGYLYTEGSRWLLMRRGGYDNVLASALVSWSLTPVVPQ